MNVAGYAPLGSAAFKTALANARADANAAIDADCESATNAGVADRLAELENPPHQAVESIAAPIPRES